MCCVVCGLIAFRGILVCIGVIYWCLQVRGVMIYKVVMAGQDESRPH